MPLPVVAALALESFRIATCPVPGGDVFRLDALATRVVVDGVTDFRVEGFAIVNLATRATTRLSGLDEDGGSALVTILDPEGEPTYALQDYFWWRLPRDATLAVPGLPFPFRQVYVTRTPLGGPDFGKVTWAADLVQGVPCEVDAVNAEIVLD